MSIQQQTGKFLSKKISRLSQVLAILRSSGVNILEAAEALRGLKRTSWCPAPASGAGPASSPDARCSRLSGAMLVGSSSSFIESCFRYEALAIDSCEEGIQPKSNL